jgi:polysaccharide export outer membrane protein
MKAGSVRSQHTRFAGWALIMMSMAAALSSGALPESDRHYVLGPADQISIRIAEGDDISDKPILIDPDGFIDLNMVGRIHAAGMSVTQLESEVAARLAKFYKRPAVAVTLVASHSQPVSVLGAVRSPGVHQLEGHKTLIEVLSLAGGLRDDAGYAITITRRIAYGPIPLPDNKTDASGNFSTAHVKANDLISGGNPEANIAIEPNDVISAPRAELVYVLGQVNRSGGFVLRDRETGTALLALSLAEGLSPLAAPKDAKILRLDRGSDKRIEIPVNLQKVLAGTAPDPVIYADDMLFVPGNRTKHIALRSLEAAIQIGTGVAIYRR